MISIVIIAAGASSRMGEPKQLLQWGNTTLLGHALEQANASRADSVYVVLGANFEKIASTISSTRAQVLKYDDWQKGMGNTIAYSIDHLTTSKLKRDAILIMLADQPQVSTLFLNQMIDAYHNQQQGIVATHYADSGAGVPAIFDKQYFDQLMLLSGDKGAKSLLNKNKGDVLALSPQTQFIDIDTRDTYLSFKNRP